MKFFSFINSLSNPEKTRNFNVFKNYSLHDFGMIVENCGLARSARKDDLGPVRISVVGTNGKGSVSHFLSEIALRNANFPGVGLYTSPHLVRPEERIRFNGKEITEMELDNLLRSFSPEQIFLLGKCSYFELFTIFSFCYFKEKNSSLEIYEAGLGGRLDSTKLATADYIVLTAIELDHMEVLGNSKDEILSEKLEIATERAKTIFAMPQDSENLNRQIEEFSVKNKIALRFFRKKRTTEGYLSYNKDFSWFILSIIADDYGWSFPPEKLNQILGEIQDPAGRMEILRKDPPLLFDIAHNAGAVQCLLGSTNLLFP
ncbi:MAG: bifunctional folylpolyglutamate synthase/dihydrofolate synthase, partial [Leptospira sp.]|nr:bifunctional folylpolyglutamate synthase/dihydrofolate synthase [Leptospira sp.]